MSVTIDHNNFAEYFIDTFGKEYEYIIKAIENNNHKKLHFLKYLSSQGFIPVGTEKGLYEMIKIFEQKFQGNQDLAFEVVENNDENVLSPYFKVLYPEVKITNTRKDNHTIKNLVVIFSLKWDYHYKKWQINKMTGLRLTLSFLEAHYHYNHSHLQSATLKSDFKSMTSSIFCLGSSTLGMSIAEYNTEEDKEKSALVLEGILYTLDTYVTWESLEGVPHNYMNRLLPLGGEIVTDSNVDPYTEDLLRSLISKKIPLSLDFGIKNNTIFIKNTSKNVEFFKNLIDSRFFSRASYIEKSFYCYSPQNSQNRVFLKADSSFWSLKYIVASAISFRKDNFSNIDNKITFFNGRKHKLVFSNYMEKTIKKDEQNIIIYPKFLDNVYRKLEFKIQKARLRSQAIKYLVTIRSAKRSSRQNQVTL